MSLVLRNLNILSRQPKAYGDFKILLFFFSRLPNFTFSKLFSLEICMCLLPTAYYIQVSKSVGFLHFTFTLELFTDQQSNFLQYAYNFEWCRRPVKNNKKECTKWNLCLRITYSMQKRQLNLMEDFFAVIILHSLPSFLRNGLYLCCRVENPQKIFFCFG